MLPRCGGMFVQQVSDIVLTHLVVLTGPSRVEEVRFWFGRAGVEFAQVLVQMAPGFIHDGDRSCLSSFPRERYSRGARRGVDVCRCQVKDFLDARGGIKDEQDDRGVT